MTSKREREWIDDQMDAFVLGGIALSFFIGLLVGVPIAFITEDVLTGFFALVGVFVMCLYMCFWRAEG